MSGDLRVAVAEFGLAEATGTAGGQAKVERSTQALGFAQSVASFIGGELQTLSEGNTGFCASFDPPETGQAGAPPENANCFDVHVRQPQITGPIIGATAAERAAQAAALAHDINAQVVIYGNLTVDKAQTTFVPEFYVAEEALSGNEDVLGQYAFRWQIRSKGNFAGNPASSEELRRQALARTSIMANLVIGLGYYLTGQYDRAAHYFEVTDRLPGWDPSEGKELLYVMLGNTAGKRGDLDAADQYYAEALRVNPEYHAGATGRGGSAAAAAPRLPATAPTAAAAQARPISRVCRRPARGLPPRCRRATGPQPPTCRRKPRSARAAPTSVSAWRVAPTCGGKPRASC